MTDIQPPGAGITTRQDQPEHQARLLAYSHLYKVAQRFRLARAAGSATIAATPLLTWRYPGLAEIIAAIAGAWLIVARLLVNWGETTYTERAVNVQELYDTKLFGLPWNTALAGREPLPDDVADAARHMTLTEDHIKWYRSDLTGVPWPADVLLCQRESAVWSRADHRGYGRTLLGAAAILFVLTAAIGLVADLTLADYLIKLGLPITPALLDAAELGKAHLRYAAKREQLVHDISDLWTLHKKHLADVAVTDCRRIQDEAYRLRRDAPRVPRWYYKIRRGVRHKITQEATRELRRL